MKGWQRLLVQILEISNYPILLDNGKVTALEAKIKAEGEYDKFRIQQDKDYISDFDREIKKIQKQNKQKL